MARIKAKGMRRPWETECDHLVITGKCVVDFLELTVLKDPNCEPEDMDPRLAILLDILYKNRNHFLSLEKITDLRDSMSEKSTKADIGKLRKLIGDTFPFTVIMNKAGLGYKFVSDEKPPVQYPTLSSIFGRLATAGEICWVCVVNRDGTLIIEATSKPSTNAICDFLLPDSIFYSPLTSQEKEAYANGNVHEAKEHLQGFYRQASLVIDKSPMIDKIWSVCVERIRGSLIRALKLKGIIAYSDPLPQKLKDLDGFIMDENKRLDLILNKLAGELDQMLAEDVVMKLFLSGRKAALTAANALDGIVAISLVAMYFLSCQNNEPWDESFLQDAEQYRKALQKKIEEVFFPETRVDGDRVDIKEVRAILGVVLADLDNWQERVALFDKLVIDLKNLDAVHRNSGIRVSEATNSSENDSPIKSR